MDLRKSYDNIMELQEQLQTELLEEASQELQHKQHLRSAPDYKKVHALSATFTLQDYFANAIAAAVNSGELEPDEDYCEDEDAFFSEDGTESEDLKHIWGVKSADDLCRADSCLYTMNDIELVYWKKTDTYSVDIETIYMFDNETDKARYLRRLLEAFTSWMKEQGYNTEVQPSMLSAFGAHEPEGHFETIEEAYADFKMRVYGFWALAEEKERTAL